ncbi:GNAT family N-acetyltransferase [Vibrio ulleungensis]|uniref:GNAT family N-acetyltransferase n=1 Tax=Vibrio ulleungensis TaxID=2807619 RepID=A0ABS2HJ68_9VIBR|nr:GNAT family N-acetyltransferase [Vibrio ulleungensis]MBM7037074.1 GNAT family N-acetyltransferase [Vibrio ulleungensis]
MQVLPPDQIKPQSLSDYADECYQSGLRMYHNARHDPSAYIHGLLERDKGNPDYLNGGFLPSATFYAVDGDFILGAIRVRRGSNYQVDNIIGHIGYETRPSARNLGVAKTLLNWVIDHHLIGDALISVEQDNIASINVIESIGAMALEPFYDDDMGIILRFKVTGTQSSSLTSPLPKS